MIAECGVALTKLLQKQMVPHDVMSPELITLRIPQLQDQDYVVGIYLYHIEEDQDAPRQEFIDIGETKRRFPGKSMSLSYVLFINEEATFGGFHKEQEDRLLERMIQIFHDEQHLQVEDQSCVIQFDSLDVDSRIRLWQSFSKPLQPAIYLRIHPLIISSRKEETVHRVKTRAIHSVRR